MTTVPSQHADRHCTLESALTVVVSGAAVSETRNPLRVLGYIAGIRSLHRRGSLVLAGTHAVANCTA